jgi:hypothetical protein
MQVRRTRRWDPHQPTSSAQIPAPTPSCASKNGDRDVLGKSEEDNMPADETIRKRDQERLRQWALTLGSSIQSREVRVTLQYLQALDVCDLLTQSAERQAEFASAALFRFGLDTLATGFWIACIATDEWLRAEGNVHIPSNLERTIAALPPRPRRCWTRW